MKSVAVEAGQATGPAIETLLRVLLTPTFVTAVACFLIGIATWIYALRELDLSLAYPTASLSYVMVALVGMIVFDEPVSVGRWIGILIIMLGVFVMYSPGAKTWK